MKKVLILFISLYFFSCNKGGTNNILKKNKLQKSIYSLAITKQVTIPIPADEFNYSFLTIIREFNDTLYLFRKSPLTDDIYVYNWKTKKRVKKVHLATEGPNQILHFKQGAFFPLSLNEFIIGTVFNIYRTFNDSVYFHRQLGSIKNLDKEEAYIIFGKNNFPPILIRDNLYMFLAAEKGMKGTDVFYNCKRLMKFNVRNNEIAKLNFKLPAYYHKKCWGPGRTYYSMTLNADSLLNVMFPIHPVIYTYDPGKEKFIDSVPFKSRYVTKEHRPINCNITGKKRMFHAYNNPNYRTIIYDPYKKVYYVFVILPVSKKLFDRTENPFTISPFSIIVFDEKFNKLTEKKIEGGIYFFDEFFVTEEGLWINKNSPHYKDFNEDVLRFDLFQLISN